MAVPFHDGTAMKFGRRVPAHDDAEWFLDYWDQPVLGTIGFPFPWKNYTELARVTKSAGWALLLIAPGATPSQIAEWRAINPALSVWPEFVESSAALTILAGCDATAFTYVCHN